MEPWICTKVLKKLTEELREKFPATTPGYSMVKIAGLDEVFLEVFLTASKPSGRSHCSKRKRKGEKGKAKKKFKTRKA